MSNFRRGMQELIVEADQEPSYFDDVYAQIVDMIKPKDPFKITLDDLVNCGQGESMINILIDVNGFYSNH
ncbi:phosphatase 2A regulatory subunit B'' subunit [Nesidiocoris tenuis]|uniref:Phosphatase 2A regulatory subunit B'' subunit n=1 Tax=Nesidiocoris tenuis TaxID=355587 RepID=A0ABN7B379_9HEMI|nr:phosphatase 2A regulatory subunit B'' subunit [Nesidiocoris tenuis]